MRETIQNSKRTENCNLWAMPEGIPWPQRMDLVHLGPIKTSVRTVECRQLGCPTLFLTLCLLGLLNEYERKCFLKTKKYSFPFLNGPVVKKNNNEQPCLCYIYIFLLESPCFRIVLQSGILSWEDRTIYSVKINSNKKQTLH